MSIILIIINIGITGTIELKTVMTHYEAIDLSYLFDTVLCLNWLVWGQSGAEQFARFASRSQRQFPSENRSSSGVHVLPIGGSFNKDPLHYHQGDKRTSAPVSDFDLANDGNYSQSYHTTLVRLFLDY